MLEVAKEWLWCDGAEFGDAGGENSSQEFVAYFRKGYRAELIWEGGVCLFSYWEQRGVFVEGGDILEQEAVVGDAEEGVSDSGGECFSRV